MDYKTTSGTGYTLTAMERRWTMHDDDVDNGTLSLTHTHIKTENVDLIFGYKINWYSICFYNT